LKKVFILSFVVIAVCFFTNDAVSQQAPNRVQDIDPNMLGDPDSFTQSNLPPPVLTIEDSFCNDGGGIPFIVTDCQGFIAAENGGSDIIYVVSVYSDPASPTPNEAPPGTTFYDVFDATDNFILYDGNFQDCDMFVNPNPTVLTTTLAVFGEPVVDLTAIATTDCSPVTVSIFIAPFDRTNFIQPPDIDVIEIPVTLYPTGITTNVVDDGSTCGTPSVELVAEDGTVCETVSGAACAADGDSFTADFAATPTGGLLAGAPDACALPEVTVTCAGCGPPTDDIPTLSQWGLITLMLMLMSYGGIALSRANNLTTSFKKK